MVNQTDLDELDLRDCIEIMVKRKKLIFAIMLITIISVAIIGFLEPKTYKATALISITPFNSTHKTRLLSNLILSKIIQNLNLKDSLGKEIAADRLLQKLAIKNLDSDSLTALYVIDPDPQQAKQIANAWAQEYLKYMQEFNLTAIQTSADMLTKQFQIARTHLNQAEEKVVNFKKEFKIDLMRTELLAEESTLNDIKREMTSMDLSLKNKEEILAELKKQILTKDKRSSIYDDLEKRILDTQIEINTLKPRSESLNNSFDSIKKACVTLDNEIVQKEFELTQLTRQLSIWQKSYNFFSDKMDAERNEKSLELSDVKIISPAAVPSYPVGHGKMKKNLQLASVIGLVLGLFITFCIEFWQKGKPKVA